ncbi:hypothetical protein LX16_3769 [Stackebrandtia albiflava]|uniref:Arsenate reductase n=1 Tax=Stackebrandtia albiflava TaxID=406432 RepID=A0A562V596_9ACTN|nr:hypothetical protein [Stackebrandtia albiflava]TWJ13002.1 hypothetical protein LX16_3769 [Stackebrandtia albiflava]
MTDVTDWTPEACTLPTAARPLRHAEFGALFATALRDVTAVSPTRLRMRFDATAGTEITRLTEAESACCSFFAFTIGKPTNGLITVDVDVPQSRADGLDGLAAHARAARR